MQALARILLLGLSLSGTTVLAQSPASCDLPRGKDVYQMCSACHSLTAKESQREGPTLAGLMGRKAGGLTGFAFSAAMRTAGWEWSAGLLDSFLAAPRKAVRGTTMTFNGIKDGADRAAVICYLVDATAAPG